MLRPDPCRRAPSGRALFRGAITCRESAEGSAAANGAGVGGRHAFIRHMGNPSGRKPAGRIMRLGGQRNRLRRYAAFVNSYHQTLHCTLQRGDIARSKCGRLRLAETRNQLIAPIRMTAGGSASPGMVGSSSSARWSPSPTARGGHPAAFPAGRAGCASRRPVRVQLHLTRESFRGACVPAARIPSVPR